MSVFLLDCLALLGLVLLTGMLALHRISLFGLAYWIPCFALFCFALMTGLLALLLFDVGLAYWTACFALLCLAC